MAGPHGWWPAVCIEQYPAIMIIWFSGNGNSRAAASRLSEDIGEPMEFLMGFDRKAPEVTLREGETLGFVWPVYCWAPPRVVEDFVSRLTVHSPSAPYVWFAATYGDSAGRAEEVFRKALGKAGLQLDAAFGLTMPETYVNFADMALDTPENAQRKYSQAREDLSAIAADILARRRVSRLVRGSMPWIDTYIVRPIFYRFLVTDRKWKVDTESCTGCGKCSRVCPFGNISIEDGHPRWNGNCTTCNACYHNCPSAAISFGRATRGKGQYPMVKDDILLENR